MPIFYHPSQVDAEEERAQEAQQQQSVIPSSVFQRLAQQNAPTPDRLNAVIPAPAGDQTPAQPTQNSVGTQQPSSDLNDLVDRIGRATMDPKYAAELENFAPSKAPAIPDAPVGFKKRFLFGLVNGLQAMGQRAAQQPYLSPVPQDDALGLITSGIAAGLGGGLNPRAAVLQNYQNNALPRYYQQEAVKAQMRKQILEEAKAAGGTAPERLKALLDQVNALNTVEKIKGARITNENLPTRLKQEVEQRGINIDTSRYKRDIAPGIEADRRRAANTLDAEKQLNIRFQDATLPARTERQIAEASRAKTLAKFAPELSQSQINRNNATAEKAERGPSLSSTNQAKAAAQQSWDTQEEVKQRKIWESEKAKDGEFVKKLSEAKTPQEKQAIIDRAWERKKNSPDFIKMKNQFLKEEQARQLSNTVGSGGTYTRPASRVAGNKAIINKAFSED